jgi:hypothetical protein
MMRKTECKHGQHRFAEQAGVGAGIRRNVCEGCGTVAIFLTNETPVTSVSSRLVGGRDDHEIGDGRELDLLTSPIFGQKRV